MIIADLILAVGLISRWGLLVGDFLLISMKCSCLLVAMLVMMVSRRTLISSSVR